MLFVEGCVVGIQFFYNGKGYVLSGDGGDYIFMEEGEFWFYDLELDFWEELLLYLGVFCWAFVFFLFDGWVYLLGGFLNVNGILNYFFSDNYCYQLEEISNMFEELFIQLELFEVFFNLFFSQVQFNWLINEIEGFVCVLNNQGQEVYWARELFFNLIFDFLFVGIYIIEVIIGQECIVKCIIKQ